MNDFNNLTDAQATRRQLNRIEKELTTIRGLLWLLMGMALAAIARHHGWI